MEPAEADREPALGTAAPGRGARKLVRLHADETIMPRPPSRAIIWISFSGRTRLFVSSIARMRISTSGPSTCGRGNPRRCRYAGERVGRNGGAKPLQRIAVVIVMRRLDEDEVECPGVGPNCGHSLPFPREIAIGSSRLAFYNDCGDLTTRQNQGCAGRSMSRQGIDRRNVLRGASRRGVGLGSLLQPARPCAESPRRHARLDRRHA